MEKQTPRERLRSELREGINLSKCRKCECMKETLKHLDSALSPSQDRKLLQEIKSWLEKLEQLEYSCLGCKHCYPAAAMRLFNQNFPKEEKETHHPASTSCTAETDSETWPPVVGKYFNFCEGSECPIAVSTLASSELAELLADRRPKELCIVGITETENIGIEKVVRNTITNPTIRVLLLTGEESKRHYSGKTFLALSENGVDDDMRVKGAPGQRPVLKNLTHKAVEAFRRQIRVVDMIGCKNVEQIIRKVKELAEEVGSVCRCEDRERDMPLYLGSQVQHVKAKASSTFTMDPAGYFVIIPNQEEEKIIVEHYSPSHELERVIEGESASSIYKTIVKNDWISKLSHAAYLGKELTKAELSIKRKFEYVQGGC